MLKQPHFWYRMWTDCTLWFIKRQQYIFDNNRIVQMDFNNFYIPENRNEWPLQVSYFLICHYRFVFFVLDLPLFLTKQQCNLMKLTSSWVSVKLRRTYEPLSLTVSETQVTVNASNSHSSSTSGQYLWHLTRPRSTFVVNITINDDRWSHTISQKSCDVSGRGPCAAMYRLITPDPGISICKSQYIGGIAKCATSCYDVSIFIRLILLPLMTLNA